MRFRRRGVLALTLALMMTASVFAFSLGPDAPLNVPALPGTAAGFDFDGIVTLGNCSGALIRFSGQPETDKAIVLTNGHCLGQLFAAEMPAPGEVIVDKPVDREVRIFDRGMRYFPIRTTRILYATMTNTDVALYELNRTYEEILNDYTIHPFDLARQRPTIGTDVDIVSGLWQRGFACAIEGFVPELKEAGWTFTDSIRYAAGCGAFHGTSGSPLIAHGTRTVVAVNSTSNDDDGARCAENNPCEENPDGGIVVMKGRKYGEQTYGIYSCLSPDFRIDLSIPGCVLPKPGS